MDDMSYSKRIMNRAADAPRKTRQDCAKIAAEADKEIERLWHEIDRLRRGEFICSRCGLRKDGETGPAEF